MTRFILPLALVAFGIAAPASGLRGVESMRDLLPNGMHTVVRERHSSPIVAIDFWVKAGSADEAPGENGCAHFLEHTLFKGTATHRVGAADYEIENLGGVLNAATGADYVHYYTELPATHVAEATAIIADIVRYATFPDAEVEKERAVILDELAKHDSDQFARIQDRLYLRAFPGQPYAQSPGGQPSSIRIRARDTLAAFFKRLYVPTRCTLAFAGDITPAQAKSVANRYFGDWSGKEAERSAARTTPSRTEADEAASPGDREAVGMAFPAPAARSSQLACLAQVAAALLGSAQDGGRFRSSAWSGTRAAARYTPHMEASLFTILARMPAPTPTRPFVAPPPLAFTNLAALEAALRSEVSALSAAPPSTAALAAAVRTVQSQLEYDIETDAGLARTIGQRDLFGSEPPEQTVERLVQVTPADIQRFAAEYLRSDRAIVVHSRAVSQ